MLVAREKLSITDTYNAVANASVNEVQLKSYGRGLFAFKIYQAYFGIFENLNGTSLSFSFNSKHMYRIMD